MSGRTTDKYVKIRKPSETAPENEIRIRAIPSIGRYISYAATLLLEKKLDTVLIKASGNAVKGACQIAEILRHRIAGLYQLTKLKTISVIDEYEPREEGLDKVTIERKLAVLEISLSLKESAFDKKDPGYQAPLPADQVQEDELKNVLEGRRRGQGGPRRGGYGGDRGERGGYGGDRGERGGDREDRGEGGFRRGRYAGPRGRGGFGRGRGGRGGYDREERGERREGGYDREDRGGRREGGYDREDRGGRREGGYDRENRGGRREGGYDREDRGERREGGYRGSRGSYRGRGRGSRE